MCQIVYVDFCLLQFGTIQGLYGDERALTFVLFYDKDRVDLCPILFSLLKIVKQRTCECIN